MEPEANAEMTRIVPLGPQVVAHLGTVGAVPKSGIGMELTAQPIKPSGPQKVLISDFQLEMEMTQDCGWMVHASQIFSVATRLTGRHRNKTFDLLIQHFVERSYVSCSLN